MTFAVGRSVGRSYRVQSRDEDDFWTLDPARNLFYGKSYTVSPSPNSPYLDNETSMTGESAGDIAVFGSTAWADTTPDPAHITNQMLTDGLLGVANDSLTFTWRYMGFSVGTNTVAVRVDAATPVRGREVVVWGMWGSDAIGIPSGLKLEYSDNDSDYTTVEDRTSLGSGTTGRQMWKAVIPCAGAGRHRYWRFTTTGTSSWTFISEIAMRAF